MGFGLTIPIECGLLLGQNNERPGRQMEHCLNVQSGPALRFHVRPHCRAAVNEIELTVP